MKIRRFVTILALVGILSLGASAQSARRFTVIEVDPEPPAPPRMSEPSYYIETPVTILNLVTAMVPRAIH